MSVIKIQGNNEKKQGIYYTVDTSLSPIGTGGMGQVYRGTRVNEANGSSRPVAIKFLFSDLPPHAIERARREASIQLRNDNLVEMLGFIELDVEQSNGEVFKRYHVVSELLTGVTLSDILAGKTQDRDGNEVPYAAKMLQDYHDNTEKFAKTVVMGVLSGLMALHDAHYIHRDIDPSNIMLTADGHIKLIDFGIAKKIENLTDGDKSLTVTGSFMGKPEYAAPELALSDIEHQNQTTDIYAVGILLYQCLVGHLPFEGDRASILEQQIRGKLPLGAIKNRGLRSIIATACEKKQDRRYQSAAQMRVALEELSGTKRALPPIYKYGIVAGCVALVVCVIVVIALIKQKQHSAMEQLTQQHEIEIMQHEVERVRKKVHELLTRANPLIQRGSDYDADYYENDLMSAYSYYEEAFSMAKPVVPSLADTVAQKMDVLGAQLDSASVRIRGQQREAIVENLPDSSRYRQRAEEIEKFRKEHSSFSNTKEQ